MSDLFFVRCQVCSAQQVIQPRQQGAFVCKLCGRSQNATLLTNRSSGFKPQTRAQELNDAPRTSAEEAPDRTIAVGPPNILRRSSSCGSSTSSGLSSDPERPGCARLCCPQKKRTFVGRLRGALRRRAQEDGAEEEDHSLELLGDVEFEGVVQFMRHYSTFWANFKLSFFVAVFMTVAGAFTYSIALRNTVFGDPKFCHEEDIFWKFVGDTKATSRRVWCGWLPNAYGAYWSNVVMMIVFTVYKNTGTTVMFAWQGIAGTAWAVLNMYVLQCLYPDGASNAIVWLDILLFYFAVLASGAATNTMMFAMNWHSFFMMGFLNPKKGEPSAFPSFIPHMHWDSEGVIAFATSFTGASLAILATIVPPPLTNFNKVASDADSIVNGTDKIWTEAIEYVCGSARSAKRFQIAEATWALNSTVAEIRGNLSNSWWENFDLCGNGKRRALYESFDIAMEHMHDVMVVMKYSVLMALFGRGSSSFCAAMREAMLELKNSTVDLLHMCVQVCADGQIDQSEVEKLQASVEAVAEAQRGLHRSYRALSAREEAAGRRSISREFIQENIFVFVLSAWARKITDFADAVVRIDQDLDKARRPCLVSVGMTLKAGLAHTFRVPTKSRLLFALRNFAAIGGSFIAAYLMGTHRKSVFPAYSATMPATLSLLIHEHTGGAILNNLKRLLGVTVGKVLPLVILNCINALALRADGGLNCGSIGRDVTVGSAILVVTWMSDYIYFSSRSFATVGCLMAAYAAGTLGDQCKHQNQDLGSKYVEIAQIVSAIFVQIGVDTVFECIERAWPRDQATQAVCDLNDHLLEAYASFFDGELETLHKAVHDFKGVLSRAEVLTAVADPNVEFFACHKIPFKIDLYREALKILEVLKADLTVLVLACDSWRPERLLRPDNECFRFDSSPSHGDDDRESQASSLLPYLYRVQGMGSLKQEFLFSMGVVLDSLHNLLKHGVEDNNFQDPEDTNRLVGVSLKESWMSMQRMFAEIDRAPLPRMPTDATQLTEDPRARVAVAMGCLCQVEAHVGELDELLLKRIML